MSELPWFLYPAGNLIGGLKFLLFVYEACYGKRMRVVSVASCHRDPLLGILRFEYVTKQESKIKRFVSAGKTFCGPPSKSIKSIKSIKSMAAPHAPRSCTKADLVQDLPAEFQPE